MICETIKLENSSADVGVYVPDRRYDNDGNEILRPGVLICAGGAYSYRSEREGELAALRFMSYGIAAFVINYTCKAKFPLALTEVMKAMAYIKSNKESYGINEKVFICGFSAGGHLALSLGIYYNNKEILESAGVCEDDAKPYGMILGYPVVTTGKYTHPETAENITGGDKSFEKITSLENHVSENTPKTFIWATRDDNTVPIQNTLMLVNALTEYNIPYTCHIFGNGAHGLALSDFSTSNNPYQKNDECKCWFDMAFQWIMSN